MAKKRKQRNRMSSAERHRITLEKAVIRAEEGVEMRPDVEQKIEKPTMHEGPFAQTEQEALRLDAPLRKLYEDTRDGETTPESFRKELITDPSITAEQMHKAISLGIESWGSSFGSIER